MNAPQTYDAGVAHQIGRYSDAIRVPADYDQIVVSGTPGLDENGNIPADFADGARQAWRNVAAILEKAGASISDIVSIRPVPDPGRRHRDLRRSAERDDHARARGHAPGPHGNGAARDPRRGRSRSARPIRPPTDPRAIKRGFRADRLAAVRRQGPESAHGQRWTARRATATGC